VPNVIGQKITPARNALHAAGFPTVGLNVPCNKGTEASQSVVDSLSVAGKPPNPAVGALPLAPGTQLPHGTRVAITWSGCFGDSTTVPAVVGETFGTARRALTAAGLKWACYSVGRATTTTTTTTSTSVPPSSTTTTTRAPQTVLTQDPTAGAAVKPGTTVSITMHVCPQ
jgi:beta-lactam-binding protein with PASTA domain